MVGKRRRENVFTFQLVRELDLVFLESLRVFLVLSDQQREREGELRLCGVVLRKYFK